MDGSPARDAYLVLDASGSTLADGVNDAFNQALPHLVDAYGLGASTDRLAVVVAASHAATLLHLTRPDDIAMIPAVMAGGIAALGPALGHVAHSIVAERARASSDDEYGIAAKPAVVLVCDGHPVDGASELADAITALRASAPGVILDVALVGHTVRTDLASLADRVLDVTASLGNPIDLGAELGAALLS